MNVSISHLAGHRVAWAPKGGCQGGLPLVLGGYFVNICPDKKRSDLPILGYLFLPLPPRGFI